MPYVLPHVGALGATYRIHEAYSEDTEMNMVQYINLLKSIDLTSLAPIKHKHPIAKYIHPILLLSLHHSWIALMTKDELQEYSSLNTSSGSAYDFDLTISLAKRIASGHLDEKLISDLILHHCTSNKSCHWDFELTIVKAAVEILQQALPWAICTELLLSLGGDDRLTLDVNKGKLTKYLSTTIPRPSIVRRGSCTCSTLTLSDYLFANELRVSTLTSLVNDLMESYTTTACDFEVPSIDTTFDSSVEECRHSALCSLDLIIPSNPQEIVFFPSGSDAEYFPLLLAIGKSKALGGRDSKPRVINYVTASGEVGSGTANAANGKHFSPLAPSGFQQTNNCFLSDWSGELIAVHEYKARSTSGDIAFQEAEIAHHAMDQLVQYPNSVVVVHLVYGSKTGLVYPTLSHVFHSSMTSTPILDLQKNFPKRVVVIVDMCQLRCDLQHVRKCIEADFIPILTGSKYFAGPPFSGAVIFPSSIARDIEALVETGDADNVVSKELASYLTYYDIPQSMPLTRKYLHPGKSPRKNVGLYLRWKLALKTIIQYTAIPIEYIQLASEIWVNNVRNMVQQESSHLQLLSVDSHDNALNTIVSIGVTVPREDSVSEPRFLTMDEAKVFHQEMTQGEAPLVMLGQPVKISDCHSIVRIALGADIVLRYFEDTGLDFPFAVENKPKLLSHLVSKMMDMLKTDQAVVSKMSALAQKMVTKKIIHNSLSCQQTIRNMEALASSFGTSHPVSYNYSTSLADRYSALFQSFLKANPSPTVSMFYDMDLLMDTIDSLKRAFQAVSLVHGGSCLHCFAIKSCPVTFIVHSCVAAGMGLEAASMGEVQQALRIGCPPNKIMFDSPCKTMEELSFALTHSININCNSLEELAKVERILESSPSFLRVYKGSIGLRINPLVGAGSIAALSTATISSKFGIPSTLGEEILSLYAKHAFLTAVMCHVGSQGMSIESMVEGAKRIVTFADEIDRQSLAIRGVKQIAVIDIGGGLSVDYSKDFTDPNVFERYAQALRNACPTLFQSSRTVITEFGKAVIAKTGAIFAKVEDVLVTSSFSPTASESNETGRPEVTAICHAGADLMLRTAYCPDKFPHRLEIVSPDGCLRERSSHDLHASPRVTVAGPLCFSGDVIGTKMDLPQPIPGDYVMVLDAGANTLSLFSRHCSRPSPPVYAFSTLPVVDGSSSIGVHVVKLIRPAESINQVLSFWD